jgi:thiamine-monophosphate kinase
MNELTLLAELRKRLAMPESVLLGPGDDGALLDVAEAKVLCAACDTLLEGTHFRPDDDPYAVGRKAVAVNLSDLAAMGCRPLWGLTGFGASRAHDEPWIGRFTDGLLDEAQAAGLVLVGGDVTSGEGPSSVTVTVLGAPFPGGPVRRAGARAGDVLAVTGPLGGSLAGRHLAVEPRLPESEWLCANGPPRAMIDLSDGLALDLKRLAGECGLGARIEAGAVPVHEDASRLAHADGRSPLDHALGDGEDFELLAAFAPETFDRLCADWPFGRPLVRIGSLTGPATGLLLVDGEGEHPWPEGGYVHD